MTLENSTRGPWKLAIVVAMIAAAVAIVTSAASAQVAEPSLTVNPNTNLTDGQQVTASGVNYPADTNVSITICTTPTQGVPGGCTALGSTTSTATGTFSTTVNVPRTFVRFGNDLTVNCDNYTNGCVIEAIAGSIIDSEPVTFVPAPTTTTLAPTTTTLAPTTTTLAPTTTTLPPTTTTLPPTTTTVAPNTTTTTPTSAILAQLRAAICPALGTLRNSPLGSLLGPVINSLLNGFGCPNSSLGTRSASTPLSCDELLAARTNIDSARTQLKADRTLSRTARNALLNQLASLRSSLNKQIRLQKCSQPAAQGVTAQSVTPATYTVQRGDSLSSIAQHLLGDGNLYTQLFALNRDQITNPSLIYRGQILRLR